MIRPSIKSTLLAAAASCALFSSFAQAAVTYQYAASTPSLTLSPGATATVNLYLIETVTSPSVSRLVSEDGLYSGYVRVTYVPPGSPLPSPSTITSLSGDPAVFDDLVSTSITPTSAYLTETVDFFSHDTGPTGQDLGNGVRSLFLGSVTLQAGSTPGATTFQIADDANPSTDLLATFNGLTPLDAPPGISPASITLTVAPIPEPATLAASAATLLFTLRRRSR